MNTHYECQDADRSYHFVDARNEEIARILAEEYILRLLQLRFKKQISFNITSFKELPKEV
ncbi:hypothetical protein NYR60_06415 [Actinobacillus genomosp. 2]|uniref:hypothetical protein n=1 Tax=Actinobacillus genomosp. 2 TaxID=230709 RepID=UPI0024411FD7|nr:hypothetical protein [Actinobacillus genomosp. 2]WGE31499.1 hypothetical protein NYR60_06415 [Actinobacillus genomosp. 2]